MANAHQILREHKALFNRLVRTGRHMGALKATYEDAIIALQRRVIAAARDPSYTAHAHRATMAQLQQGMALVNRRMASALGAASGRAQRMSVANLVREVAQLEQHFTGTPLLLPIEEAARFRGLRDRRRTSLLAQHATSFDRYGGLLVNSMERQLSVSLATGETTQQAVDRIAKTAGIEYWRAERIARTEIAGAYNATQADALAASGIADMHKRWTEFVDDATGRPLDDRVADDSLVLHGQVAPPMGLFTMPRDPRVPAKLWGRTWAQPPNRPNDRARLEPWRPHWAAEVPGYIVRGGERVWLSAPREPTEEELVAELEGLL